MDKRKHDIIGIYRDGGDVFFKDIYRDGGVVFFKDIIPRMLYNVKPTYLKLVDMVFACGLSNYSAAVFSFRKLWDCCPFAGFSFSGGGVETHRGGLCA